MQKQFCGQRYDEQLDRRAHWLTWLGIGLLELLVGAKAQRDGPSLQRGLSVSTPQVWA